MFYLNKYKAKNFNFVNKKTLKAIDSDVWKNIYFL